MKISKIVLVIIFASSVVWVIANFEVKHFQYCEKYPTECLNGQEKCELAGGIFYGGGFGASNCVFPPKR